VTADGTVSALLRACGARDLDAALALLADDVEYDNVPLGSVTGRDRVREVLAGGVNEAAREVEWVVLRQVARDDVVMSERLDRFLLPGGWLELPVVGVFVVRDGRVVLWRDYFDLQDYREQKLRLSSAR
jgi:limonene-1,2-epoxide hydrolase